MLDKAEDPEKIARLMIQEMEDTLIEVRTGAARAMADKRKWNARSRISKKVVSDWDAKAELAIDKGREDLARGARRQNRKPQPRLKPARLVWLLPKMLSPSVLKILKSFRPSWTKPKPSIAL